MQNTPTPTPESPAGFSWGELEDGTSVLIANTPTPVSVPTLVPTPISNLTRADVEWWIERGNTQDEAERNVLTFLQSKFTTPTPDPSQPSRACFTADRGRSESSRVLIE